VVGMMTWIEAVKCVVDLLIVVEEKCRFGAAVKKPVGLLSPLELTGLLLPFHSDDVIFFMIFSPGIFYSTQGKYFFLFSFSFYTFSLAFFSLTFLCFFSFFSLLYKNFTIMRKKSLFLV
jgi:hypothetical protein